MTSFSNQIILWYEKNRRDLPWRVNREPYYVWLSEIILQQTRVAQGLPYFNSFIDKYRTIQTLANAKEKQVLRMWQGLGYYSRARNLHKTANIVANEYGGVFPDSYSELKKLPGIGAYTASAIASICFGQPVAVVDGNVIRLLSRYHAIETAVDTKEGNVVIRNIADELLDVSMPGLHNEAMMEFGALQCVPQSPDCINCICIDGCSAGRRGNANAFPVKKKRTEVKDRYFHYIVFVFSNMEEKRYGLKLRENGDIWQGLYDFPLILADSWLDTDAVTAEIGKFVSSTASFVITNVSRDYLHKLTHQRIHARFFLVALDGKAESNHFSMFSNKEIERLPKPVLVVNYLKDYKIL